MSHCLYNMDGGVTYPVGSCGNHGYVKQNVAKDDDADSAISRDNSDSGRGSHEDVESPNGKGQLVPLYPCLFGCRLMTAVCSGVIKVLFYFQLSTACLLILHHLTTRPETLHTGRAIDFRFRRVLQVDNTYPVETLCYNNNPHKVRM